MPPITPESQTELKSGDSRNADEPDPFLRLHKMSTTAGLGSGDYVAINSAALAALLFGIASFLVLWGSLLLLIIPGIAILCALTAFIQISNSNGTQTGRGLAGVGVILALAIGGGFTGREVLETLRNRREQKEVIVLLEQFGGLIAQSKYEQAYDLCDDRFRARVPESTFVDMWKVANASPIRGGITGATWNGLLKFDDDALTNERQASGIILISFSNINARERQSVVFLRSDGNWRIDQIPDMFPTASNAPPGPGAAGAPAPGGLIGPPAPPKNK